MTVGEGGGFRDEARAMASLRRALKPVMIVQAACAAACSEPTPLVPPTTPRPCHYVCNCYLYISLNLLCKHLQSAFSQPFQRVTRPSKDCYRCRFIHHRIINSAQDLPQCSPYYPPSPIYLAQPKVQIPAPILRMQAGAPPNQFHRRFPCLQVIGTDAC